MVHVESLLTVRKCNSGHFWKMIRQLIYTARLQIPYLKYGVQKSEISWFFLKRTHAKNTKFLGQEFWFYHSTELIRTILSALPEQRCITKCTSLLITALEHAPRNSNHWILISTLIKWTRLLISETFHSLFSFHKLNLYIHVKIALLAGSEQVQATAWFQCQGQVKSVSVTSSISWYVSFAFRSSLILMISIQIGWSYV